MSHYSVLVWYLIVSAFNPGPDLNGIRLNQELLHTFGEERSWIKWNLDILEEKNQVILEELHPSVMG